MGGAIALLLHRQAPSYWDGAVLVAPMCKVCPPPPPPPPFFCEIIIINIHNFIKKKSWNKTLRPFFFGCKKIADDMKPNPVVTTVLTKLCKFIPTWKLIPTEDVVEMAFKEPEKREEVCFLPNLSNPI